MINDGINNVPDNTIAIIPLKKIDGSFIELDRIKNILRPSSPRRDWFDSHFYRCLPLTIANSYGFTIESEFDFAIEWNGGKDPKDITFTFNEDKEKIGNYYPRIESHFGHGVITINPPFALKTPPGVNLLTINPTNHILTNLTVMSGSVETDNLRRNFTFNLKMQIPNIKVVVPKHTPLASFIPIPRYYIDNFKLENAGYIFNDENMDYEYENHNEFINIRNSAIENNKFGVDRYYYSGKDAFEEPFKDHQKP